jgi:NAD(P)-dependent dehydrogenase (short-subunit alcohol dehydrogenase family)
MMDLLRSEPLHMVEEHGESMVDQVMAERRPVALITGAGSGLGLESALHLAARGFRVFGTVLTETEGAALCAQARERKVPVSAVHLDVTSQEQIHSVVDSLLAESGRLDALIHFAGMGLRGFFEDLTLEEIRQVYEVNVFGIMALTQAVLPQMRRQRSGRIVITSSSGGRMGTFTVSGYASTKFAVEGLGECLAQEASLFGIYVSLVEPGLIQTPHFTVNRNQARRAMDPESIYHKWFLRHEQLVDSLLARKPCSPADVAAVVYKILTVKRPRLRYIVGTNAKIVLNLRRYIPGELFERLYWAIVRRILLKAHNPFEK